MTALKVAVIGAGYFAQFHHEAWRRHPRTSLVAVVDRDAGKAAASGADAFADIDTMIAAARPDIVDIATPPDTHLTMIGAAIEHGVGTIVCQKPFCGDHATACKAAALADAAGVALIVHENFRFQPWYRTMREMIASGLVGPVRNLTFRLRPGDGQGADAYLARQPYFQDMPRFLFHETGVHWIDTFRFLLGEPDWVYADARRLNDAIAGEDAGLFLFGYDNGARAMFDGNRLLDHVAENRRLTMGECTLEGDNGEVRLMGNGSLHHRQYGTNTWDQVSDPVTGDGFGGDCVYALQSHIVAGVLDGTEIENRAADYIRNMWIEEQVYASIERGARIPLGI